MPKATETQDIVIKGVETDEELRKTNDLIAKAHCQDYFQGIHWLESIGATYPGFRREHTRIAHRGNDIAAALRMNTETIRIGEARLRMGGFGWVTTDPRYRNKGLCRSLILDALEYMRHNSYHVSMLFGIPNFYHRFGYATTLADYAVNVDAGDARVPLASAYRVREAKPGDIPAIQRIHNANDAEVSCSLLRTSAHLTNKWEHCKGMRVLTTDKGKVLAYIMAHRAADHLSVKEVGLANTDLCAAVLQVCGEWALDEATGRLRFLIPPAHPFARFLLHHRSTHEMHVSRDAGGMLAFVNLAETLESMIPEWETLLAGSAFRAERTEITLLVERTPYRIRANRGAVDVAQAQGANRISLSTADLIHLLTGYAYVEDILATRRRIIRPESRTFLATLFPKRCPFVWHFDRF